MNTDRNATLQRAAEMARPVLRLTAGLVVLLAGALRGLAARFLDFAARRPRAALAVTIAALLLSGTCIAQARRAAAERRAAVAAAAASDDAMRRQAEAYRRYQDYEYVKRVGPITGPWYSNKW